MPRRLPKLCQHRRSGRAYVTDPATGGEVYLGAWGSPEAEAAYDAWIREFLARRPNLPPRLAKGHRATVAELCAAYRAWARTYYVKHGRITSEVHSLNQAIRFVVKSHRDLCADDFGPRDLVEVREAMVAAGLAREHINDQVHRIRRVWRWGVEHELIGPAAWQSLKAVPALAKGRTAAPEGAPVKPAAVGDVARSLKALPPTLRKLVKVQLVCAMRPQDVVRMRPADIDRSAEPWVYTPGGHKGEHRGLVRKVWIGPRGRRMLAPLLAQAGPEAWLFPTPRVRGNGRRKGRYTTQSYRRALTKAMAKAGLPRWTPLQLRHTMATAVRAKFGLEAAQVYLGHAAADVTQLYAERDERLARQVAEDMG